MNHIIIDGVKYYKQKKLECPRREDFFVATGEVKFGGMYQPTGYINETAYAEAKKHFSSDKTCENKSGYYCKKKNCAYPKCLICKCEEK